MKSRILTGALLAGTVLLSACSVFPEQEPPRLMDLRASDKPLHDSASFRQLALRIDTPRSTHPHDSNYVLIKPTPFEFQHLPGVRWRDSAPILIRERLIQSLRRGGSFSRVVGETSPAPAQLQIISELQAFQITFEDGQPYAAIRLHTDLLDTRSRSSLCARGHEATVRADGVEAASLSEAFSEAAGQLEQSIHRWTIDCSANPI